MFNVIEAIHADNATDALSYLPEKLLLAMIFDYSHNIDGRWMIDHAKTFIHEFQRRDLSIEILLEKLPEDDREDFIAQNKT